MHKFLKISKQYRNAWGVKVLFRYEAVGWTKAIKNGYYDTLEAAFEINLDFSVAESPYSITEDW